MKMTVSYDLSMSMFVPLDIVSFPGEKNKPAFLQIF